MYNVMITKFCVFLEHPVNKILTFTELVIGNLFKLLFLRNPGWS